MNSSVRAASSAGDPASFDAALAELSDRVERLAPRLAAGRLTSRSAPAP